MIEQTSLMIQGPVRPPLRRAIGRIERVCGNSSLVCYPPYSPTKGPDIADMHILCNGHVHLAPLHWRETARTVCAAAGASDNEWPGDAAGFVAGQFREIGFSAGV